MRMCRKVSETDYFFYPCTNSTKNIRRCKRKKGEKTERGKGGGI